MYYNNISASTARDVLTHSIAFRYHGMDIVVTKQVHTYSNFVRMRKICGEGKNSKHQPSFFFFLGFFVVAEYRSMFIFTKLVLRKVGMDHVQGSLKYNAIGNLASDWLIRYVKCQPIVDLLSN